MHLKKLTILPESGWKYFNHAVYNILGILCVILFISWTILSIPVYVFRAIVTRLAKWIRPDLGNPLDAHSSSIVGEIYRPTKPPRINLVVNITLDGNISLAEAEKAILEKWIHGKEKGSIDNLKYPQFCQYPVSWLGFMFWKTDTKFDIKNHIHVHSNPNGVTDNGLNELVETLVNDGHHPTRSPWELHILQNYKNPKIQTGKMSVIILKVHHSLGDGYSLLHALTDLTGQSQFQVPKVRSPKRGFWKQVAYSVSVPLNGISELMQIFQEAFKESPWKIHDNEKAWHQYYGKSDLIPIQHVKQIKNTFGVSFTSVLLSAVSCGITKNLEGKRRNNTLRGNLETNSMYCFSALPLPANDKLGRLKNHATGALLGIPTRSFLSSLDRLSECNRVFEKTKNSVLPALLSWYSAAVGSHFHWVAQFIFKNRIVPTGLTNFPSIGDDFTGDLGGKNVISVDVASGALEGVSGVGFVVISCRKHIRVAVTAEQGLLSREEVDSLVKAVQKEISRLYFLSNRNNDEEIRS